MQKNVYWSRQSQSSLHYLFQWFLENGIQITPSEITGIPDWREKWVQQEHSNFPKKSRGQNHHEITKIKTLSCI